MPYSKRRMGPLKPGKFIQITDSKFLHVANILTLGSISAQNHRLSPYNYRILACTTTKTAHYGKLTQKKGSCTKLKGHKFKIPMHCTPTALGNISAPNQTIIIVTRYTILHKRTAATHPPGQTDGCLGQ